MTTDQSPIDSPSQTVTTRHLSLSDPNEDANSNVSNPNRNPISHKPGDADLSTPTSTELKVSSPTRPQSNEKPKKRNKPQSPGQTSVNTMTTRSKAKKKSKHHGNIDGDSSMCSVEDTGDGDDLNSMLSETEDNNNNNDR